MRARIGLIGSLLTLPFLAGCFDMSQDLTITSNGTSTMVVTLAMATDMLGMMEAEGDGGEFCPAEDEDSGLPDSFTTEVEVITEGDNTICRMTATGPIADMAAALASGELMPGDDDEGAPTVTLVDEGGGVYLYSVSITIPDSDPVGEDVSEEERAMNEQMQAMMRGMFEGHTMSWSVTAPRIIDTDAERDGNTIRYSIPLTAMVDNVGETFGFMVRFGL
ncbi:MAG: hypothetical protein KIS96_06155 [Bauldia sp.]|nr:hypothetical protein [Bauldia sp.]